MRNRSHGERSFPDWDSAAIDTAAGCFGARDNFFAGAESVPDSLGHACASRSIAATA